MQHPDSLPESELEVMLTLWRYRTPMRTSRILQDISHDKSWTLSTLKVLLARLEQKDYITCTRDGRFTLYQALVPEEEYRRTETCGLLKRFYQNSAKHMIASLVADSALSREDLAELATLLESAGDTGDA